jgi:hypothetical protein
MTPERQGCDREGKGLRMGNSWQVLPSPRPLLLWLGADAICVALLALLALALLALWRRPARLWRLGMAALVASWAGIALTLRVFRAYSEIKNLGWVCTTPYNCAIESQTISNTVVWGGVLSAALIALTLAALVAAVILSGLERGRQRGEAGAESAGAIGWMGRLAGLATLDLFTSLGVLLTAQGVFDWITYAPLLDPRRSGDGLGQLPLLVAISTTGGGAIVTLLTGFILLSWVMPGPVFLWRRRFPRGADAGQPG